MTPDDKHPAAAFWITVALLAVLVGYPLSFGPACWLSDREALPYGMADSIYRPLMSLGMRTNCNRALEWYGTVAGLPDLPPKAVAGTDCRLFVAVQIRLNAEQDLYRSKP